MALYTICRASSWFCSRTKKLSRPEESPLTSLHWVRASRYAQSTCHHHMGTVLPPRPRSNARGIDLSLWWCGMYNANILRGRVGTKNRGPSGHAKAISAQLCYHEVGGLGDGVCGEVYYPVESSLLAAASARHVHLQHISLHSLVTRSIARMLSTEGLWANLHLNAKQLTEKRKKSRKEKTFFRAHLNLLSIPPYRRGYK